MFRARSPLCVLIHSHYFLMIATCFLAFSLPRPLHGQLTNLTPDTSTPLRGTGKSYIQNAAETIDPLDGSLSIRINVPMPKGRGSDIPFSFAYDTNATSYPQHQETTHYQKSYTVGDPYISGYTEYLAWVSQATEFSVNGWSYTIPNVTNNRVDNFITAYTGNGTNPYATADCYWFNNYIYSDPDGGRHNLGLGYFAGVDSTHSDGGAPSQYCPQPDIFSFQAGPYLQSELIPENPRDGVLVQEDSGTVLRFPNLSPQYINYNAAGGYGGIADQIVDKNGNKITITHPAKGGAIYTDTVGRNVLTTSGFGNSGDTVTVAGLVNPYTVHWETVSYPGLPTNVSVLPMYLGQDGAGNTMCESSIGYASNIGSESVISDITLPNGQAYGFQYDSQHYGFVKQITYPSGGTVKYTWTVNPASAYIKFNHDTGKDYIYNTNEQYIQVVNGPPCEGNYDKPAIATRDISYDGVNVAMHEDYKYSKTTDSYGRLASKQTVVTTHDLVSGNVATTTYNYAPGNGDFVETSVVVQSGGSSVETTYKEFLYETVASNTIDYQPIGNEFLGCERVERDGVLVSLKHMTYAWALPLTQTDYSSGSCTYTGQNATPTATGTAARTKTIAYANLPAAGEFPVYGAIMDRPSNVTIQDGSGNTVAETDYRYDETAVSPVTAVQHDEDCYGTTAPTANCGSGTKFYADPAPNSIARGNVTTVTQKCSPSCSDAVSHYTYDETGQVTSYIDPNKNPSTNYSYTDSPSVGNAAVNSNAYLTQVTRPATNGVQHITKYTYDYGKGLMTEILDENSQPTDFTYESSLNRLHSIQGPPNTASQRPTTIYNYTDSPPTPYVTVTTSATPDPDRSSTTIYDGMGNATQSQHSDPQGTVTIDTGYDGSGNVSSISNPYRSGDTVSRTVTKYDVLNRPIKTTETDGSFVTFVPSGLSESETDEAGNTWTRTNDTLGHLIKVVEPGSLTTSYTYDVLGNLQAVQQVGRPGTTPAGFSTAETSKARSFTYDSLSRLIASTNPETGTVCYGTTPGNALPNASNCTEAYDANGNLQRKTDASGIVTYYTYDVLNRVLSRYAPDIPPLSVTSNHLMTYDQGANGVGRLSQEVAYNYGTNQFISGTQFQYDAMGRVSSTIWGNYAQSQVQEGTQWQPGLQVQYDLAGNITQLTYADGRLVSQTWDAAGHLSSSNAGPLGTGGAPYISAMQYAPSGALQSATLGNGVSQTLKLNSRLQPCHQTASSSLFPASTSGGNLMDRQEFYSSPSETNCGNAQADDGNIKNILEGVGSPFSQSFVYDGLNRLTQANSVNRLAATTYSQVYKYDSFGNMLLADQLHSSLNYGIDGATNRLSLNGDVNSGDLRYNANGTLSISPNGVIGYHTYMWTAEGNLRGIDGFGTGSYLYDSMGERTLAVRDSREDEYVYLNNQPMADLDVVTGNWQDFIYANGQKIATVDSRDAPIHISGDNCTNCGGTSSSISLTSGAGHVIQAGDVLSLTQYNVGNAVGGLILVFTDGSATSGLIAQDQYGQQINCDPMSNQFLNRHIDLSAYAGKTLTRTLVINDVCSPSGHFDQYFNDIAISSPDGTVTTIYSSSLGQVFSMTYSSLYGRGPVTNMRAVAEPNTLAAVGSEVQKGTHYYLTDQVGTTQLELSGGGWPVWQGYFTPFGQEIQNGGEQLVPGTVTPDGTSNRYKFTGKERDAESGLDYFGARYYASSMGRFTSPDPLWIKDDRMLFPQRLNLYAYAVNNPLRYTDPTGMDVNIGSCPAGATAKCEAAITNGVPKGDRSHIHFVEGNGKNGYKSGQIGVLVDADYKSKSGNFTDLQKAANDHSATANLNFEPSGFQLVGEWSVTQNGTVGMTDFQAEAKKETGTTANLGGGFDGYTFYQNWGNPQAGLPYSGTNATEVYLDMGETSGNLAGTTQHEMVHVLLGDFGRSAGKGVHGAPGVDAATKRAQEEGKRNATQP